MILEIADVKVRDGYLDEFESAFRIASPLIASIEGYISHDLQRSMETPGRYVLLVKWETLEAHTVGFRESAVYQEWKRLLHHFYEPPGRVEHFERVVTQR
jgi:heme-degrading monooxygenase HmoA